MKADHQWKWVAFKRTFHNPVVVAKPLSSNDEEPAVVRLQNRWKTGFKICVQEWEYLDGEHSKESIGYMVLEAGAYTLPGGVGIEAGTFETDRIISLASITFSQPFNITPVVIAAVNSINEMDAVTIRLKNITQSGFGIKMQEKSANLQEHVMEKISYIAWQPDTGSFGDFSFEKGLLGLQSLLSLLAQLNPLRPR